MDNKKTVFEDFVDLSEDFIRHGKPYAAFLLLYITIETQLRKLITFILRNEPHLIHWNHIKQYIEERNDSNIDSWISLFDRFHKRSLSAILIRKLTGWKAQFRNLKKEIKKNINNLRDKLFHGVFIYQDSLKDIEAEKCNNIMLQWINLIRDSMKEELRYDGLGNIKPLVKGITTYQFDKNSRYEDVKKYIESYRYR